MPKPFKTPQPREERKPSVIIDVSSTRPRDEIWPLVQDAVKDAIRSLPSRRKPKPGPTPEMLRAAAAAHLADQHSTLWARSFNIHDEDRDTAADWLADTIVEVLDLLST